MDGDSLAVQAKRVSTYEEFIEFLGELQTNCKEHPSEWDNSSLESYIEGLCGFAKSASGYYVNTGQLDYDVETPSWRGFADLLLAGKVYE